MNEAIILLTHEWGPQLEAMYNELNEFNDVYILADKHSLKSNTYPINNPKLILFDKINHNLNIFHSHDIFFKDGRTKSYMNIFLPILIELERFENYDRVWLIESDVRYNGHWESFFSSMKNQKHPLYNKDILCGLYKSYNEYPGYFWYPGEGRLSSPTYKNYPIKPELKFDDIPQKYWAKALFCISRISIKFLTILKNEMPRYNIFFETLIPTLANYMGYTISDLGEYDYLASNYSNKQINSFIELSKIHHAVKEMEIYDYKEIKKAYNAISAKQGLIKIFLGDKYVKFLNKHWVQTEDLVIQLIMDTQQAIEHIIKTYKPGSKEFCRAARELTIINDLDYLNIGSEDLDKFITNEYIENVGDYLTFLIYYINKYGKNDIIMEACEHVIQNQLFCMSNSQLKYLEDELLQLWHNHVCDRILIRLMTRIHNEPTPYNEYIQVDKGDKNIAKFFEMTNCSLKSHKYFPF